MGLVLRRKYLIHAVIDTWTVSFVVRSCLVDVAFPANLPRLDMELGECAMKQKWRHTII